MLVSSLLLEGPEGPEVWGASETRRTCGTGCWRCGRALCPSLPPHQSIHPSVHPSLHPFIDPGVTGGTSSPHWCMRSILAQVCGSQVLTSRLWFYCQWCVFVCNQQCVYVLARCVCVCLCMRTLHPVVCGYNSVCVCVCVLTTNVCVCVVGFA